MPDDLPPINSSTYVKESALAVWENLPWLILYGFLFTIVSLPALLLWLVFDLFLPAVGLAILTTGPAWTALTDSIARILRREPHSFGLFFKAFGKYHLRSLLLAALLAVPAISLVRDLPLLAETPVESYTWIRLGTAFSGSLFLLALAVYAYPILVLYNVSARLALKNGLVLAVKYAGNTAGLLAMAGLLAWLAFRVSEFLFIVLIPAWLVFLVNNTRMVLEIELGPEDKASGSTPPDLG